MTRGILYSALTLILFSTTASGRGVSPYLPLNLEPEMERQIERVLILGDKTVLTRPIPAAIVLDALPKACAADVVLCAGVRRFLARYMQNSGISHASVEIAAASGDGRAVPNRYGLGDDSAWAASATLYWQPGDHSLVSLGGVAYDGNADPTGSMLSLGFDFAQLDVGYRPHWLSPMEDSAMILGTESQTMPSVTLSNYRPLTRAGLTYEVFLAQMSRQPIRFQEQFTEGYPRLAGVHLAIEPTPGWSLGINRVLQFGGGGRERGFSDFFDAFFRPSPSDNVNPNLDTDEEFGNQAAAISSRFLFPGRTPFAVYFEYAGEDAARGGSTSFGNASLAAGIHFPRLWRRFDLTFETSEWQNGWYVHHVYAEGLTNEGNAIGHWGGDQRVFNDGVGAQAQMLRLGWTPGFGGSLELQYRTLDNESYTNAGYERSHDFTLRYMRPWHGFSVGAEARAGSDVFGESFSRIAAIFRYTGERNFAAADSALDDEVPASVEKEGSELFVDAGVSGYQVQLNPDTGVASINGDTTVGAHVAIGARRAVGAHHDLGARIELDDFDGRTMISLRALDYRYRFAGPIALTAFLGASRYDLPTAGLGAYIGFGAQWRNVLPGWDLGLDLRFVSNVSRDRLLPSDPPGVRPDLFYDVPAVTAVVTRRF